LQQYGEAVLFLKHEYEKTRLAIAENQLYNEWAYQDAIKTYDSIVKQFPDSPYAASAQFMKGICYRWMNEPQLEIAELKKAAEKYPNAAAYYYLSKAYQRQDMYQEALNQYQKILDEYPESNRQYIADANYNIGKCLEALGRTDEAVEHYERFLEKYKNDKEQDYLYSSARIALEYLKRSLDTLPFLGVALRRIDGKVVVTEVIVGSAAEQAGIQEGDVILSVDEKEIQYPKSVVAAVISKNIGDIVVVTIMRNNQKLDISATLRKK
jgi:tetratricopeptide (TPR) repeat protein